MSTFDRDPVESIAARWRNVGGRLDIDYDGDQVRRARVFVDGRVMIDLIDPGPVQIGLLQRMAAAPGDVRALLAEVQRLDERTAALETAARRAVQLLETSADYMALKVLRDALADCRLGEYDGGKA